MSGVLGKISEFESHFDRYRTDIVAGSWKEDRVEGTGVLYNLGSHMIDQALQLFGMPHEIFADLRIIRKGGSVFDYYFLFTIKYRAYLSEKDSPIKKFPNPL